MTEIGFVPSSDEVDRDIFLLCLLVIANLNHWNNAMSFRLPDDGQRPKA
jgi:hypothetical protein